MGEAHVVHLQVDQGWRLGIRGRWVRRPVPAWLSRVDLVRNTAGSEAGESEATAEASALGKRLVALLPPATQRWLAVRWRRFGELVLEADDDPARALLLLPWELIWLPPVIGGPIAGFLVGEGHVAITRRIGRRLAAPTGEGAVIHVASPDGLPGLDTYDARRQLARAAPNARLVLTNEGTAGALAEACTVGPSLVYVACHGNGESLLFESADRAPSPVDAGEIAALIARPCTVVLSTCLGGAAEDLRSPASLALDLLDHGMNGVLTWMGRVPDALAAAADAAVIGALSEGCDWLAALGAGRVRLREPFVDAGRERRCPMAWSLLGLFGTPPLPRLGFGDEPSPVIPPPPIPSNWSDDARRFSATRRLGLLAAPGVAEDQARALLRTVPGRHVEVFAQPRGVPALPAGDGGILLARLETWLVPSEAGPAWISDEAAAFVAAIMDSGRPLVVTSAVRAPVGVAWQQVAPPEEALVTAWSRAFPAVGRIRDADRRRQLVRFCGLVPGLIEAVDAAAAGYAHEERRLWDVADELRMEWVSSLARWIPQAAPDGIALLRRCLCLRLPASEALIGALGEGIEVLAMLGLMVRSPRGWQTAPFLHDAARQIGMQRDPDAEPILAEHYKVRASDEPINAALGFAAAHHSAAAGRWADAADAAKNLLLLYRFTGDTAGAVRVIDQLLDFGWPRRERLDLLLELYRILDHAEDAGADAVLQAAAPLAETDAERFHLSFARLQRDDAPPELAEEAAALALSLTGSADSSDVIACRTARAFTVLSRGALREAEADFRTLIAQAARLDLVPLRLLSGLANALHGQGHYEEAHATYEQALECGIDHYGQAFHPELVVEQTGMAEVELELGLTAEAELRLRGILATPVLGGTSSAAALVPALRALGALLNDTDREGEAERIYRALLARPLAPADHSSVLTQLGHAVLNGGRTAEAVAAYEEALRIDTALADHHSQVVTLQSLAAAWEALGDLSQAEAALVRAITIAEAHPSAPDPDAVQPRLALAELLLDHGREVEAEVILRRISTESGASQARGQALRTFAQHLGLTDRDAEAEPVIARAVPMLFGIDRAIGAQIHAGILRSMGRLSEAEATCLDAISRIDQFYGEPDHADLALPLHELSGILLDAQRLDEAEEAIARSLRVAPGQGATHVGLVHIRHAELRVAQGRIGEAIALYAGPPPGDDGLLAHSLECRGVLHASLGEWSPALTCYRHAWELRLTQEEVSPARFADLEAEIAACSNQPPSACGRLARRLFPTHVFP